MESYGFKNMGVCVRSETLICICEVLQMVFVFIGCFHFFTEWVQMAPPLFSKFIPNILPPAVESELEEYAAQDQKLQQELIQEGFSR